MDNNKKITKSKLLLGSHVSMKSPFYLEGAVKESVSYGGNSLMFYLGSPRSTFRPSLKKLRIKEFKKILEVNKIPIENVFVHAPYIINLATVVSKQIFDFSYFFFEKELLLCEKIGLKTIILHPGSYISSKKNDRKVALKQLAKSISVLLEGKKVKIALETMSGKGTQICSSFEDLKFVIDNVMVDKQKQVGVCLDTCHLYDAGYDICDFEKVLVAFQKIVGLEKIFVVHLNDSKNTLGSKKDRHENIGKGKIGLNPLLDVCFSNKLTHVPKILETPWINKKPPYKDEINEIKGHYKKLKQKNSREEISFKMKDDDKQ